MDLSRSRYVSSYKIALIHAGLGEADPAFAWLERAVAEHDDRLVLLGVDFQFDPVRGDARFAGLLRRAGLLSEAAKAQAR